MASSISLVPAFRAPDDLTELDQWLVWRRERETKVPYSTTGRRASSTDPSTWCSYGEALEVWRRHPQRWAGIGFVFHESDPFVGLDLDASLDDHANPKPWARGVVERFADTYCEISPSGSGLKIWCRGSLPTNVGKVAVGAEPFAAAYIEEAGDSDYQVIDGIAVIPIQGVLTKKESWVSAFSGCSAYPKLHISHDGYASTAPIVHKSVAVSEVIAQLAIEADEVPE